MLSTYRVWSGASFLCINFHSPIYHFSSPIWKVCSTFLLQMTDYKETITTNLFNWSFLYNIGILENRDPKTWENSLFLCLNSVKEHTAQLYRNEITHKYSDPVVRNWGRGTQGGLFRLFLASLCSILSSGVWTLTLLEWRVC